MSTFADHLDDNRVTADETARVDPERRRGWETYITATQEALTESERHLTAAIAAFDGIPVHQSVDPLLARVVDSLRHAQARLQGDKEFIMQPPTDTYIGNKAAFAEAPRIRTRD